MDDQKDHERTLAVGQAHRPSSSRARARGPATPRVAHLLSHTRALRATVSACVLIAVAACPAGAFAAAWGVGVQATLPADAGSNPGVILSSVSCAAAGNCSAVGYYFHSAGHGQGLLVGEAAGSWDRGLETTLPADAASTPPVFSDIVSALTSVSCGSPGNCAAVGAYADDSGHGQGLLLSETAGVWARGVEAPLPANAGSNPGAALTSVSCSSPGNCTAVGSYTDSSSHIQGLLLTETAGTWSTGVEPSLPADTASAPDPILTSVSCPAAGNCAAVGQYVDKSNHTEGVVLTQTAGRWSTGVEAALPTNVGSNPGVFLNSVSCAAAGNCTAVGQYDDDNGHQQGLVVSGAGARGVEIGAPANAGRQPNVFLNAVSCARQGACSIVGSYQDSTGDEHALESGQSGANEVSLPANASILPYDPQGSLGSVSCAAAGNCGAAGDYNTYDGITGAIEGLFATQTAGGWAGGVEAALPADAGSDTAVAINSISCPAAGSCSAVGSYNDTAGDRQGLLLDSQGQLTVSKIETTQGVNPPVSGDADQLVEEHHTLTQVTLAVAPGTSLGAANTVEVRLDVGSQALTEAKTVAQLLANPTVDFVYDTPAADDAPSKLTATVDPSDKLAVQGSQSQLSEPIDVVSVRDINLAYANVDYLSTSPSVSGIIFRSTLADSVDFLDYVYPLAPSRLHVQVFDNPYQPTSGSFQPGNAGAREDAWNLFYASQLLQTPVERVVAIVPHPWFVDHGYPHASGLNYPDIPQVAFVHGGEPMVVAHELGHSYGLNRTAEDYSCNPDGTCPYEGTPTSGYKITSDAATPIADGAISYMGAGLEPPPIYPSTLRWSTPESWAYLLQKFHNPNPGDPRVLLITGSVNADGTASIDRMYASPDGVPTASAGGDTQVDLLAASGRVVSRAAFQADFTVFDEPQNPVILSSAPFAIALPYPRGAARLQLVRRGHVVAAASIASDLLTTVIAALPSRAFHSHPARDRRSLVRLVAAFNRALSAGARGRALHVLRTRLRPGVVKRLRCRYRTTSRLQYTKLQLLSLLDQQITQLGGRAGSASGCPRRPSINRSPGGDTHPGPRGPSLHPFETYPAGLRFRSQQW